jgi:SAM-dependent methyltransferase
MNASSGNRAENESATDYAHIENTYDVGSEDYAGHSKGPLTFIEPERAQFIQRIPEKGTILDCGCGPGFDSERFCRLGFRVTEIDLSDRFVALARERVPGAEVRKMDMRYLDFPNSSFDGIWSSFSLLHIQADEAPQTLAGFRRVLRDGGLLFVALHRGPTTSWIKTIISGMERDTYVQEWTQTDFENVLSKAGFEILGSRPFLREGGRYPLLGILAHT